MKKFLLIASLFTAISCTHQNQQVKLGFYFDPAKSNAGNGSAIQLEVFDDRSNKVNLGYKKFGEEKIEITANQNLEEFLRNKISEGLIAKGFKIAKGTIVEIHIETLKYKAARHFPVGQSEAHSTLKVIVRNSASKNEFTKNYKLDVNNKHFIAPLESTDEATINSLLQEITSDIITDDAFLKSLM
jgi:uncharacterized lipoprotein YajG